MSASRPVYSRPRTKVYDSNYNLGESYYKPALDRLDRKYGGRGYGGDYGGLSANGDVFGTRAAPPPPVDLPRAPLREMEDDDFFADAPRRRPNSALIGELESMFEGRMRNGMAKERTPMSGMMSGMMSGRTLDDEIEEDVASSMRRLKAKSSRAVEEFDEFENSLRRGTRPKMEFSDKVMDSVGLSVSGRPRSFAEDEGSSIGRRLLKMSESGGDDMMKWTAMRPSLGRRIEESEESSVMQSSAAQSGAASRARKSRARLEDLESEMQALSEKSAAREKRVRDLRALVQDNEASALDNLQSTVRVKSSIQSEKKMVSF